MTGTVFSVDPIFFNIILNFGAFYDVFSFHGISPMLNQKNGMRAFISDVTAGR